MQLPDTHWRARRSEYSRYGPRMAPTETFDLVKEPGHKHRLAEGKCRKMKKMHGWKKRGGTLYKCHILCPHLVQNNINKSVHVCGLVLWVLSPVGEQRHLLSSLRRWGPSGTTNVWLRRIQGNSTAAWANYITMNHTE